MLLTFEVAGYLGPLVADLGVHAQQQLVLLLCPGADVQPFLEVVGVALAALLVGSSAHQLGHLIIMISQRQDDGVVMSITRTSYVQVARTADSGS